MAGLSGGGRTATGSTARLERHSVVVGVHLDEESVGTNGVGTALETIRPVTVTGVEHYVEALHRLCCVAVPLRHPATKRVEGVVNLTCLVKDANPLMRPTLLRMASEIEAICSAKARPATVRSSGTSWPRGVVTATPWWR